MIGSIFSAYHHVLESFSRKRVLDWKRLTFKTTQVSEELFTLLILVVAFEIISSPSPNTASQIVAARFGVSDHSCLFHHPINSMSAAYSCEAVTPDLLSKKPLMSTHCKTPPTFSHHFSKPIRFLAVKGTSPCSIQLLINVRMCPMEILCFFFETNSSRVSFETLPGVSGRHAGIYALGDLRFWHSCEYEQGDGDPSAHQFLRLLPPAIQFLLFLHSTRVFVPSIRPERMTAVILR